MPRALRPVEGTAGPRRPLFSHSMAVTQPSSRRRAVYPSLATSLISRCDQYRDTAAQYFIINIKKAILCDYRPNKYLFYQDDFERGRSGRGGFGRASHARNSSKSFSKITNTEEYKYVTNLRNKCSIFTLNSRSVLETPRASSPSFSP